MIFDNCCSDIVITPFIFDFEFQDELFYVYLCPKPNRKLVRSLLQRKKKCNQKTVYISVK